MPGSPPAQGPLRAPRPVEIQIHHEQPTFQGHDTYRSVQTQIGTSIALTRRWFEPRFSILLLFTTMWAAAMMRVLMHLLAGAPTLLVLLPILHLGAGSGMIYYALANLLNRSRITLASGLLTISHGPLPWAPGCVVAARRIRDLRLVQVEGRHGRSAYALEATLDDGKAVRVLKGLPSREQGAFLEQTLQDALGLSEQALLPPVGARCFA
ncbi:hypothetical protein [Chondromyces crocatus]|nr:hypothetical protein [Chondromyces crocatus]